MIYLQLFWTFFKIGLFTIGGGQAMIPMIIQEVVEKGWLTSEEVQSFIAISESTSRSAILRFIPETTFQGAKE